MKAAVITMHSVANYGSQLQTFATQEKLKQYYDDVVIIDYRRPDTYGLGLIKSFAKGNALRGAAILPTMLKWRFVFGSFQKKYLNLSVKKYLNYDEMKDCNNIADVFFSGSDQVWNTGWNHGIIPPYYLDFVNANTPMFSYASSFGKASIDDSEKNEVAKMLKRYDAISVREESGKKIIQEQLGIKKVERILDPTLMMDAKFWRKFETKNEQNGDYILIYNLNRNSLFDKYAEKLAEKTGLKLVRFCTRYDQIIKNGRPLVIPSIFDFINAIDNAKYVLTDSFHATAFSINFGIKPICVFPEKYSGRLSDFLKLVGAEGCHVGDFDSFDVLNYEIDFNKVNQILDSERKKGDDFLNKTVKISMRKLK